MERVSFDYQNLLDYNYLMDRVVEDDNNKLTDQPCSENTIFEVESLLMSIIDKSKKIMGEQSVSILCRNSNIVFTNQNQIVMNQNICETLNNFVENLIMKGGNIIKIMLHNLSHEINREVLEPVFSESNHPIFYC